MKEIQSSLGKPKQKMIEEEEKEPKLSLNAVDNKQFMPFDPEKYNRRLSS